MAQPIWDYCRICCLVTYRSPLPEDLRWSIPVFLELRAKSLPDIFAAAHLKGELGALLVSEGRANPVSSRKIDPDALKGIFIVVQDLFLTETAALADVVFPAASLYEKSGTVTNAFGDVQMVRKAADRAGTKPDFEILVRLAGSMGVNVKALVPFGKSAMTADLGQSRGAQAGEADRHAVWPQEANGLEPKLSPFDPLALLDGNGTPCAWLSHWTGSIYSVEAMWHSEPAVPQGFVPVSALTGSDSIAPSHDGLFTSTTHWAVTALHYAIWSSIRAEEVV